jgi:hypothetical protein
MIDPLISKIIAIGFCLLLLGAAGHKLSARESFRGVLEGYRLFPAIALRPLSLLVPFIELALGAAWLFPTVRSVTAVGTAVLLATYGTAITINLLRGRAYIDCGCGFSSATDDHPLSWTLVVRNLMLLSCALPTLLPQAQRSLRAADYLVLVLALAVILLLHGAVSQLLKNRAAMSAWSLGNE